MKRKICAVTGSRAEYGLLKNVLQSIKNSKNLELLLVVTGAHLSKEFGFTINEILDDGFNVAEKVQIGVSSDSAVNVGKSVGRGIIGLVECLNRLKPDIMLIVGDRYEIFAAASAAMILNVPIAHISGGEITEGVIDEQIRHAITKMSHIHFTTADENSKKVLQMGEESWRVHTVGGLWVDNIKNLVKLSKSQIKDVLGIELAHPSILVTYHPETLQFNNVEIQIKNLLNALDEIDAEIIFTYSNADAGGNIINSHIQKYVKTHARAKAFKSLGSQMYLNLLFYLDLIVGNSSSGVVETQGYKIPVVNIGSRQKGRLITENIICTETTKDSILIGIKKGLNEEFKKSIAEMRNPYDQGGAGESIVKVLSEIELGPKLLRKKFCYNSQMFLTKDIKETVH